MIRDSLGSTGASLFIEQCTRNFLDASTKQVNATATIEEAENRYLKRKLAEVDLPSKDRVISLGGANITPKVQKLIDFLEGLNTPDFAGLVFVETRAEVAILSQLLHHHLYRNGKYSISTFVGESNFSGRGWSMSDLVEIKDQKENLEDFRQGSKNLVVTTAALEEGIDIAKCSVVICFDKPQNIKSFIQRRVRARKSESKYVIMFEKGRDRKALCNWQKLEEEMRQLYMEEMREIQGLKRSKTRRAATENMLLKRQGTNPGE